MSPLLPLLFLAFVGSLRAQSTSIPISIPGDLKAGNATELLIFTSEVAAKINSLTNQVKALTAELQGPNAAGIADLNNLTQRLTVLNGDITSLNATYLTVSSQQASLASSLAFLDGNLTCFRDSGCIAVPSPTTPAPPSSCPTAVLFAGDTPITWPRSGLRNSNCSTNIQANTTNYHVTVRVNSLTLDGHLSSITFSLSNTISGAVLFNESVQAPVNVTAPQITLTYNISANAASLGYNITYSQVDACQDLNCGNGTCTVQPDGSPLCSCQFCYQLNTNNPPTCTITFDPCASQASGRDRCRVGSNPNNRCVNVITADQCAYECHCQDGSVGTSCAT